MLICAYCIIFDRKKSLGYVISSIGSFSLVSFLLNQVYSGWYKFFIFTSPFGSDNSPSITPSMIFQSIPGFWWNTIFALLPITSLFIIGYIFVNLGKGERSSGFSFYIFCAAGMVGTSWASIVHLGGYKNDLIPAFYVLSILFGLSIQRLVYDHNRATLQKTLLLGACVLQFVMLYYPVTPEIPTSQDLMAGQALIAEIQKQPGDVYIPFHPELTMMVGKHTFASWNAMYQLEGGYGGGDTRDAQRVKVEFSNAMEKHEFSMIVLDKDINWVWGHPEKYYYISNIPVFSNPDVFWPVTGWPVRPTIIMYPDQK
jgi:hypothetical protein